MNIMTKVAILAEKFILKDGSMPDMEEVFKYLDDNFDEHEMFEASSILMGLLFTI